MKNKPRVKRIEKGFMQFIAIDLPDRSDFEFEVKFSPSILVSLITITGWKIIKIRIKSKKTIFIGQDIVPSLYDQNPDGHVIKHI